MTCVTSDYTRHAPDLWRLSGVEPAISSLGAVEGEDKGDWAKDIHELPTDRVKILKGSLYFGVPIMVKVAFRYTPELVEWIKQAGPGSRWNPNEKVWDVPDSLVAALKAKAEELGVQVKVTGEAGTEADTGVRALPRGVVGETYGRQPENLGYMEWEKPAAKPPGTTVQAKEGDIRLRRSKDGRFVIVSMTLIANTQELEQLLSGERSSVRFRILPPRPPPQNRAP